MLRFFCIVLVAAESVAASISAGVLDSRVGQLQAHIAELEPRLPGQELQGSIVVDDTACTDNAFEHLDAKAVGAASLLQRNKVTTVIKQTQHSKFENMDKRSTIFVGSLVLAIVCVCALSKYLDVSGRTHLAKLEEAAEDDFIDEEPQEDIADSMTYDMTRLRGWRVFVILTRIIWDNSTIWLTMAKLWTLGFTVGVLTFLLTQHPDELDPSKFGDVNSALNVFVVLMLSFFLSLVVQRWQDTAGAYMSLFNAIRNLQMQLHTLGAPDERVDHIVRFGVVSCEFLSWDLKLWPLTAEGRAGYEEVMWKKLDKGPITPGEPVAKDGYMRVLPEEREVLVKVADYSGQMWLWVASLLGRMAQDGEIPGMATPTYGRIMNLAQDGQEAIRQVRMAIQVRVPFVYMHTLATLVHVNNILYLLTLGLTLGTYMARSKEYNVAKGESYGMVVLFVKCIVNPFLFQAFLDVGIALAEPFSNEDSAIPINRMLRSLQRDLKDAHMLATTPILWERPKFGK